MTSDGGSGTSDPGGAGSSPTNGDLARLFDEIGDLLEIKGEIPFKTVAYHRAAEAIAAYPESVAALYRDGRPPKIAGVGEAIAKKIDEIVRTGHLVFLDRLREEIPSSVVELLRIPGVGPRTASLLYAKVGVATLADLRVALDEGRLDGVRGISARTVEAIRAGLEDAGRSDERMRLGVADAHAQHVIQALAGTHGLERAVACGSLRRRRETIGDIDILAITTDPAAAVERFVGLHQVERVLVRGETRASVRLVRGPQVDLLTTPPEAAGSALVHFTGSKEHNVRLRGRARDRGWSLSEKGFIPIDRPEAADVEGVELPADEPVMPETAPGLARLIPCATEPEAYRFLELDFVEPELREDRGEIEAAAERRLPKLITPADLRGDLHMHSDWTDGTESIERMAEAFRARGLEYAVLSDHTQGLPIARGLTPERFLEQRGIVDALNRRFEREAEEGRRPFRLLLGCELEIRVDATLDFDDEVLARFDLVVASLHLKRNQPREQLMERVRVGLRSPYVHVLGHPSGRLIGKREDLDLDWPALFAEAAETGTILEINGSDERLDLNDVRTREAVRAGCFVALDSDAHRLRELVNLDNAVSVARRVWLEPDQVANAWPLERLLTFTRGKVDRVG